MRIFRYDESVNIRQHLLAISCIFNCMCTAARTFIDGRRLHTIDPDTSFCDETNTNRHYVTTQSSPD